MSIGRIGFICIVDVSAVPTGSSSGRIGMNSSAGGYGAVAMVAFKIQQISEENWGATRQTAQIRLVDIHMISTQ